jgi:hypothetical protein
VAIVEAQIRQLKVEMISESGNQQRNGRVPPEPDQTTNETRGETLFVLEVERNQGRLL